MASSDSYLLCLVDCEQEIGVLGLAAVAATLTGVEPLPVGFNERLFAQASSDDDRTFDRRIAAQVEVGRLAMTKSAPRPLSAIVGGLPVGMMQELAQALKPGRR